MMLEANTSEVRQKLNELGDRAFQNEQDEYRVVGNLVKDRTVDSLTQNQASVAVQKLELLPLSEAEVQERDELENTVQ